MIRMMAEEPKINEPFIEWLQAELDRKHWKRSDLARAGDINPTTLTNIYLGRRNAGGNVLKKISIGLDVPEEVVFHEYGMITKDLETDDIITQILHELGGFNKMDKEEILEYVRLKRRLAEKNGTYTEND